MKPCLALAISGSRVYCNKYGGHNQEEGERLKTKRTDLISVAIIMCSIDNNKTMHCLPSSDTKRSQLLTLAQGRD